MFITIQALVECIAGITKNCRYRGLDFSRKDEYSFDEIPGLKAVGWEKEEYERQR